MSAIRPDEVIRAYAADLTSANSQSQEYHRAGPRRSQITSDSMPIYHAHCLVKILDLSRANPVPPGQSLKSSI